MADDEWIAGFNLVECTGCEFVFVGDSPDTPLPDGTNFCPNCGGSTFRFLGGKTSGR